MHIANVFDAKFEYDDADPESYRCGAVNLSKQIGAPEETVKLFDIPPGKSLCPYHYEFVEEWLLVLEGTVELRVRSGTEKLAPGALVQFPSGPEGAHKLTNRGEQPVRAMMWSSARVPSVAVYPDSDKIGVWTDNDDDTFMLRRADGSVGYYDGEPLP